MPDHLVVDPGALLSAAGRLVRTVLATEQASLDFRRLCATASADLAPLLSAQAIEDLEAAWAPILLALTGRAVALARGLETAGGHYDQVDAGLATLAGVELPDAGPRRLALGPPMPRAGRP